VLMAVIEAGSIVRAAEAIGLSPSGVSRALARLEARVGVRLVDRTTRALSLTDEGRRFYEGVAPHLAAIEEAALDAAGSAGIVRGRLRVNIDPFFARIVLADRIAAFLARHPDLALELVTRDAIGDLVADGFDLAVRFGEPPSGSFVARKLIDTRILTVCDVYDALISKRVYRPAWTHEDAMALLRRESGTAFDARCVAALELVVTGEASIESAPLAVSSS